MAPIIGYSRGRLVSSWPGGISGYSYSPDDDDMTSGRVALDQQSACLYRLDGSVNSVANQRAPFVRGPAGVDFSGLSQGHWLRECW